MAEVVKQRPCNRCLGSGKKPKCDPPQICDWCDGSGLMELRIPHPIREGQMLHHYEDGVVPSSDVAAKGIEPLPNSVVYSSGAVRSADAEATAYTLISPVGLRRLAETCREGAAKYGDYNWEKGMPVRDMLEHGIRHVFKYLDGDRSEDHLAHAAWNLFGAMHSEERWPHLNENLRQSSPISGGSVR